MTLLASRLPIESLSPMETRVARLIAEGLANKEIARRLGVQATTIKVHVSHILVKLGVTSRVQVAVLVVRSPSPECEVSSERWMSY